MAVSEVDQIHVVLKGLYACVQVSFCVHCLSHDCDYFQVTVSWEEIAKEEEEEEEDDVRSLVSVIVYTQRAKIH